MSTQRPGKRWIWILIIVAIVLFGGYFIAVSWVGLPSIPDWLSGNLGPAYTCNSDKTVLLTPLNPIAYIANDQEYLYWIMRGNGQDPAAVMKMSKSRGEIQVLANLQLDPYGLLVDDNSVFWVEGVWQSEPDFVLKKVDRQGGDVTELWRTHGTILQLTMDADYLYWEDYGDKNILRMPKKGGEPEVLVAGLEDLIRLSVLNGKNYLASGDGLSVMEQQEQTPRTLITTDELLQKLNIGLRDERSIYYTDRVIQDDNTEIIFEFYVGNYPGMVSCSDNATYILGFSKTDGTIRSIAVMSEYLTDIHVVTPYLYLIGGCVGGKRINIDTGEISDIELGSDAFTLAVDENHLFWTNREGLKCIQRPK